MQLQANEIHVWTADLTTFSATPDSILTAAEMERARRLHSPLHQANFIAAHSILRQILSRYLSLAPQEIVFSYTSHKKPYINQSDLQFNMSHSHNMALYAITLTQPIGVDIEKIENKNHDAVAKRYFTTQEYQSLQRLPITDQNAVFYQIWAAKEAMIKAVGKGFSLPLSSFSISLFEPQQVITIENKPWSLAFLSIHPDFAAAVASSQITKKIVFWDFP